jgi:hypothetical protein
MARKFARCIPTMPRSVVSQWYEAEAYGKAEINRSIVNRKS